MIKKVHQIWLGEPPDIVSRMTKEVERMSTQSGWGYYLWDDSSLEDEFPNLMYNTGAENYQLVFKADIYRTALLYRHGGLYLDCDCVLHKDPTELVYHAGFMAPVEGYSPSGMQVYGYCFYSEPGTKVLESIMSYNVMDPDPITRVGYKQFGTRLLQNADERTVIVSKKVLSKYVTHEAHHNWVQEQK